MLLFCNWYVNCFTWDVILSNNRIKGNTKIESKTLIRLINQGYEKDIIGDPVGELYGGFIFFLRYPQKLSYQRPSLLVQRLDYRA
jgi:hypothetical protein